LENDIQERAMTLFNSSKKLIYALLIAFLASMALSACSSSEESGDTNMECDSNDTQKECADDIM
jgi:hypothetical protein